MMAWYFFSDAACRDETIERMLTSKQYPLTYINQVEDMKVHLPNHQQTILFLKTEANYDVYELCQEVSVLFPHVYIILIVPDQMENMKRAMQVGASDLLKSSFNEEELEEIIAQAEKYMQHRASKDNQYPIGYPKKNGRVISICNPKGGIGRTTLAVNLAVAFSKQNNKVAVIDANLQFGEIALYFDIKPKRTIYEWVKEAYGDTQYSIDLYLMEHSSGVSVLAAPPRPEFFEFIAVEHLASAIEELKTRFDVVIIDPPAYLSEIQLTCMKNSDEILVLLTNDIPVLRTTKLFIDTLDTLNFKAKVKLILNKVLKNKGLDGKRIEEILGMEIFDSMPDQDAIVKSSINEGIPYILSQPTAPISKAAIQLSEKLSINNESTLQPRKKEKHGFLFKR